MESVNHLDKEQKGVRKPAKRHRKNGSKALQEIKYYQKTERRLIQATHVKRIVRKHLEGLRIRQNAFDAIHEAVEDFATILFRATQIEAIHAKRKTIFVEDMRTVRRVLLVMRGQADLDPEPVNPKMSEAHKKQCRAHRSNRRQRKRKEPIPLQPACLSIEPEAEREIEIEVEEVPLQREEVPIDDDWLL